MAEYSKIVMRGLVSENSDYSGPKGDSDILSITSTSFTRFYKQEFLAPTAGAVELVDASETSLASIGAILIKNNSTTSTVVVTWTDLNAHACTHQIPIGGLHLIMGVVKTTDVTVQGVTADSELSVFILGT